MAWTAEEIGDQTGRTAIVTGANSGIGLVAARELAGKGAVVVVACRDTGKGDAAVEQMRQELGSRGPEAEFEVRELDLADLDSVRAFAAGITNDYPDGIDLLINNAGVMMCPEGKTADGFETQFGTNHLGHFALTAGLMPALAPGARVVVLSSGAHTYGTCDNDDLNWESREYNPTLAYGQSKTANLWFASELHRRYSDRLLAVSVHPGVIETDLSRHLPEAVVSGMRENFESRGIAVKSVPQGAATSVWAATSPEINEHGGAYLLDCQVSVPATEDRPSHGYAPWAYDPESEARLWEESERLTSVSFS